MKLLYGTTNPAKLLYMREQLSGLDIELICLKDIEGEIPDVKETGDTPLENAELKARAYYKAFGIPVFSCDSGLYFDNLPEYSPKIHVRNIGGKCLTDDEMIEYYGSLAAKHGDIVARYRNAICFVMDEQHVYTDFSDDLSGNPFLLTSVPHPKRIEGFPLDSISKYIENGEYCYDCDDPNPVDQLNGFARFFGEILGKHKKGDTMTDIFKYCPEFENKRYLLRFTRAEDCADLLKVYSDEKAVPLFNSDNCHGDDFHYTTMERMKQALDFWQYSYENRYFVRWTIIDKLQSEAIGTIELFHRDAEDSFTNCGLLRLDLRSDHENSVDIKEILSLIIPETYQLFSCDKIATKAVPQATERIAALEKIGFEPYCEKLIGHDGTEYGDYYVLER